MTVSPVARIRVATLAWAALILIFAAGAPLLWSASPLILASVAALGAVIGALTVWLVRIIRRSKRHGWLHGALAGAFVATGAVAAPIYWVVLQPALHPLTVPRVTLSDGKREVVFQGMAHVASEQFYRSVVYDLVRARAAGFVLFFEGTLPGTPEAEAWLTEAVHVKGDLNAQYARIGEICGLTFQGDFLAFVQRDQSIDPIHLVNADVSATEMYEEWNRLVAGRPELATALAAKDEDDGSSVTVDGLLAMAASLGDRQKAGAGALCRGVLSSVLGREESDDPVNAVILDFRKRKLADRIAAMPDANIYITYGSAHLPGLLDDLRNLDPTWTIESTAWTTAIVPPDDAVGQLRTVAR